MPEMDGVFTEVAHYVDIDKGVVTMTVDPAGLYLGLGAGIYHSYDVILFTTSIYAKILRTGLKRF